MKKILSVILFLTLLLSCLSGCGRQEKAPQSPDETAPTPVDYGDAYRLVLSGDSALLDGEAVEVFDYTWHCDPSTAHDQVKNAPAEYYTGTAPQTEAPVYIDHELTYFPALPTEGFSLQNYDGEMEWVYRYTDGVHDDYIFATLPALGQSLPTDMMHTPEEAAQNQVLHIVKPGTYVLEGEWKGQVWVDLGDEDDTFYDPEAKVTLILSGADITCTVAPALVFRSAYECDNDWESRTAWSAEVDTSDAGVKVILAEGTENSVTGENIYRMLKTVYKDESDPDKVQKKLRKIDSAFYSYVTMDISGEGGLTVTSGFEGLDSELHLSISGGRITINSQDDGINVNEDNVSVFCMKGGDLTIHAALGAEGDGIDSNGFIALEGGTLRIDGITAPDSAMDSEDGIYYTAGTIILDGQTQSYTPGSVFQETGGMGGPGGMGNMGGMGTRPGMPGGQDFDLQQFKDAVAALPDTAGYEDVLALLGGNSMQGQGPEGDWPGLTDRLPRN